MHVNRQVSLIHEKPVPHNASQQPATIRQLYTHVVSDTYDDVHLPVKLQVTDMDMDMDTVVQAQDMDTDMDILN